MPEYDMTDDEHIEFGLEHISEMFGDFDRGSVIKVHTWRATDSQPLLCAGYHQHIPGKLLFLPDCFLATQAQVYPDYRGTHTAIREGRAIAQEVLKSLTPLTLLVHRHESSHTNNKCCSSGSVIPE
jgi:protoporphyrinogen oxidase